MSSLFMNIAAVLLFYLSVCNASIRLNVEGSELIDPSTNSPILLNGFTWYLPYVSNGDTDLMQSLIPGTNMIRIVGLFWDNWVSGQALQKDCRTNDSSTGYIKPSCIDQMDFAITEATKNKNIWVIITGRAEYAAGQDYPTYPDVFHNASLREEYYTMWQYVANHYKTWDYIAAYEIMAEPRTKITPQTVVRDFYNGACQYIRSVDMDTPCLIGPAPFYKPWMLNDTMIINDTKTIYTVDYFIPVNYVTSDNESNLTYPGIYPCNIAYPGWTCSGTHNVPPCFCPGDPHQLINVNKTWLTDLLLQYPLTLRKNANVPVLVNQWGVEKQVPNDHGRLVYATDMVSIYNELKVHNAMWIWKWKGNDWTGYDIEHNFSANNIQIDHQMVKILNASWS